MSDDFYPFVDSGDPAPNNDHLTGAPTAPAAEPCDGEAARYACRIAVYDDMLSTPRVLVVNPRDVRSYLEEVTNTVYRCMKEQGGRISLMVIREVVENFIHAHFVEPIISILDNGDTIRFADQGPGITDKERAFEFGVTSADREKKRYIRGTGAGFPMIQQYLENAGGAVSIEDNLGQGTVVTVTVDPARTIEVRGAAARGAAVRGGEMAAGAAQAGQPGGYQQAPAAAPYPAGMGQMGVAAAPQPAVAPQVEQSAGYQQAAAAVPYPAAAPGIEQHLEHAERALGAIWNGGAPAGNWGGNAPGAIWNGNAVGWPGIPQPAPQPTAQPPFPSERGRLALGFLARQGTCGPTELVQAFGSSNATWSRELDALSMQGLVVKMGQKRVLTDMGRIWVQQNIAAGNIV